MSPLKEVEVLLRKVKKENRELKKAIEEKDLHIKFLNERLDNWADKNALLREEKLKITVDDVIAFQKAKAEYASSQNRSLTEQLEKQEKQIKELIVQLGKTKEKQNDLSIKNSRLWQKEQIRLQHDTLMQKLKAIDFNYELDVCAAEYQHGTVIFPAIEIENEIENDVM